MFYFHFLFKFALIIEIFGQDSDRPLKPINRFLNPEWLTFKQKALISTNDSAVDLSWRRQFDESYEKVNKHNLEYQLNPEKIKFRLKMTEFAHMSDEEFLAKKTGLLITSQQLAKRKFALNKQKRSLDMTPNRPKKYDSREKYPVAIRDQGNCGGCYAFSAVASIEFQLARRNRLASLSEQNFIDCSTNFGNLGCSGGTMDAAFDYMIQNKGLNLLFFYPYSGKQDVCKFRSNFIGARLKGYGYIDTEEELEEAVFRFGAVSCGIDAGRSAFRLYSDGIYNDPECSTKEINHAINVVGYTEKSFICRNSWGTNWGMDGYFELPKGKNACGV